MVPAHWRTAIVHLGPVAQECDPALVNAFGDAFVGLTPQGWMRRWDRAGHVSPCQWEKAEELLARADAVVLSEEDVGSDEALVARYAAQTRLLVVTQAAAGCTVYVAGQTRHFPAPVVHEVDPTTLLVSATFSRRPSSCGCGDAATLGQPLAAPTASPLAR
jgi:sugar/nucleoside kinase (ribokinase family)